MTQLRSNSKNFSYTILMFVALVVILGIPQKAGAVAEYVNCHLNGNGGELSGSASATVTAGTYTGGPPAEAKLEWGDGSVDYGYGTAAWSLSWSWTHTYSSAGTYVLILTGTDQGGTCHSYFPINVTAPPPPQTCTDPGATNYGGELPCKFPPPPLGNSVSCSPSSQTAAIGQTVNITASGASSYSWSSGGTPGSDNDASYNVSFSSAGTYSATVSGDGKSATCSVVVGGGGSTGNTGGGGGGGGGGGNSGGGSSGGGGFGVQNPDLKVQICPDSYNPPNCPLVYEVPVNQDVRFRAMYTDNNGMTWTDKSSEVNFSLSNEYSNANQQEHFEYDYRNSCSVGYCWTARGVRFVPLDSITIPPTSNNGRFRGVVTNYQDCLTSGSGCPSIGANYSGTGGYLNIRIIGAPPPPPAFDYSLSSSGNSSITKTNGNASIQNTITNTLLAGVSQPVTLSLSGMPSNSSYSFSPVTCSPNCTSTITFTVTANTPMGTYPITVTGSPLGKQTMFNLVVSGSPVTVSCAASPGASLINQPVTWTGTVSGGTAPLAFIWFGTNIPTSPAPNVNPYIHTYRTTGLKTAQLTVRDADGIQSTCQASSVRVNFNPVFEEF